MYKDKRVLVENELEKMSDKDKEFKLFYNYVKKIYWSHYGIESKNLQLWQDFPYDLYQDIERWIDKKDMNEMKEYIDFVKTEHSCVKESARLFWSHWLSYKNINKKYGKL